MSRLVENAEGLLILADALVEASSESPDLIIDCATLTGIWTLSAGRGRKGGEGVGGLWSVIRGGGGVKDRGQGLTGRGERRWRMPLLTCQDRDLGNILLDFELEYGSSSCSRSFIVRSSRAGAYIARFVVRSFCFQLNYEEAHDPFQHPPVLMRPVFGKVQSF